MTWPASSITNPEPVAPPSWPSYSAEIWTVLGSSSCATAATEVLPPLIGAAVWTLVVSSPVPVPPPSDADDWSLVRL